ncbi:MAG: M6 family metalloprotease domain-containing protein, partial [Muribaculaceae bacterium]|nr:M6 family metalloprotease domain-containing protein [Muribaculaceae bacterium]
FFTDMQGRMLMSTDAGFRLASQAEAQMMLSSMPSAGAPQVEGSTFPTTGSPRALVILVEFADNAFSIDDPYQVYSDMLSLPGFSRDGATGSIADYFRDSSFGQFTPQFDLYGPVKLSQPMSYYGTNKSNGDDIRPDEMVTEACELLDDIIDFHNYDADGDSVIDNVYVFYAGYGENDSGLRSTIWPHSWDIAVPAPGGAGRTVYFDGLLINHYACSNELRGGTTKLSGIGTFVHEFGHVLGLPDLYSTRSSIPFTPGAYSVMDRGSYNNDCHTPPHYSAYERYALGWVEPSQLSDPADVELRSIDNGGYADISIITTSNPYEYYLLENRQQSSWDEYIPGHGMILWHIDYDPDIWDQNTVNTSANHLRVDLVEADGIATSATRAGDTFPGTSKVTSFNDFH